MLADPCLHSGCKVGHRKHPHSALHLQQQNAAMRCTQQVSKPQHHAAAVPAPLCASSLRLAHLSRPNVPARSNALGQLCSCPNPRCPHTLIGVLPCSGMKPKCCSLNVCTRAHTTNSHNWDAVRPPRHPVVAQRRHTPARKAEKQLCISHARSRCVQRGSHCMVQPDSS